MTRKYGVQSIGLIAPIIREGDSIVKIVSDTVLNSGIQIEDKDIIGITESVVARAAGTYATIDEVAEDIKREMGEVDNIFLHKPIYSRNRFAMILKAFARAAKKSIIIYMPDIDEVGNVLRNHPFTGLNYDEYYKSIVEAEGKDCYILHEGEKKDIDCYLVDCGLHLPEYDFDRDYYTLRDFCRNKCEWGLLGSNKASEEKLKLFPDKVSSEMTVQLIQQYIALKTGKKVEVFIFGDGAYKDPDSGIFEFADPVTSPAYTEGLEGTPNEIKIKNFADDKFSHLKGEDLKKAIQNEIKNKKKNLKGNMNSQGTTPRRYINLLSSLADLTVSSGDKGCPIVYIKNYFKNYADD